MRLFTLEDANALIPRVGRDLRLIKTLYAKVDAGRDASRAAAAASHFGGGMAGGTAYVTALYEIGKMTSELQELGIDVKDPSRGLIDFPSMRGDRIVFLCWELGDGDEIRYWHETADGFAGRREL
ncbi:MAG: DUF2203 domain-containing protein [Pyrinomonadaceae bacterium]